MKRIFAVTISLAISILAYGQTIQDQSAWWDGKALYFAHILNENEIHFDAPENSEGVYQFSLKKISNYPGGYTLIPFNDSTDAPFRAQFGWIVEYTREEGMYFLSVKNPQNETVWVLTLTPDNLKNCRSQRDYALQQPISDMATGYLMDTGYLSYFTKEELKHMLNTIESSGDNSVISRTNKSLIASELKVTDKERSLYHDCVLQSALKNIVDYFELYFQWARENSQEYHSMLYCANNAFQGVDDEDITIEDILIDMKNGYMSTIISMEGFKWKVETCYWRLPDENEVILATNVIYFHPDGYSYSEMCEFVKICRESIACTKFDPVPPGIWNDIFTTRENKMIKFFLPHTGKNIRANITTRDGNRSYESHTFLQWNGNGFIHTDSIDPNLTSTSNCHARVNVFETKGEGVNYLKSIGYAIPMMYGEWKDMEKTFVAIPASKRYTLEIWKVTVDEEYTCVLDGDSPLMRGEPGNAICFSYLPPEIIPTLGIICRDGFKIISSWIPSFSGMDGSLVTTDEFILAE